MMAFITLLLYILDSLLASYILQDMQAVYERADGTSFEQTVELVEFLKTVQERELSDFSLASRNALLEKAIKYDVVSIVKQFQPCEKHRILKLANFYDSPRVYRYAITLFPRPSVPAAYVISTITLGRPEIFKSLLNDRTFDFSHVVDKLISDYRANITHSCMNRTNRLLFIILKSRPELVEFLKKKEHIVSLNLEFGDNIVLTKFLAKFTSKLFPLDLIKKKPILISK